MTWWVALFIALLIYFYFNSKAAPREITPRAQQHRYRVASRVGKEIGRNLIKHPKWAAPNRKRVVRRHK
jgi:hypothetical protein